MLSSSWQTSSRSSEVSRSLAETCKATYTRRVKLRTVHAIRYICSLREGGSLPALVEADDGRQYVVKLRGAGQGALSLVAEVITGELARRLELPVPEIVYVHLDEAFGRQEPDPEIQDLFKGSRGLNVGLAFLAGATLFDPASGDQAEASLASRTVWLDAFTLNIDRTPRNANLLVCKQQIWLIDHGASLYFHHHWPAAEQKIQSPFHAIADHVLLPWATDVVGASRLAHQRLDREVFGEILDDVPAAWLLRSDETGGADARREAYLRFFLDRLSAAASFEQEIERARG